MTIQLYRHPISGHSHRAELFLALLHLPFEKVDIDLASAEQKQAAHLARNPFGQIPVLEDGEVTIADSNAILVYLATRYDASGRWLPRDPVRAAQVQRWLSVAAGPLVDGPAKARVEVLFGRPRDPARHGLASRLFDVLEQHLTGSSFLVGNEATIADIALYTYTSHAPEGGISLAPYPHVRAWLSRIEALPGFVGMKRSPDAPALNAS